LTQSYQKLSGTLSSPDGTVEIADGRLRGNEITFSAGPARYTGLVKGNAIAGVVRTGDRTANWSANRAGQ
jgi:hypothetical protein